jgi:hypothetical protein
MRVALLLSVLFVVADVVGVVGAVPAWAVAARHCSGAKGTLVMVPGLTDFPTDQTVGMVVRLSGCSLGVGSGGFVSSVTASQATCATLTGALQPTVVTVGWADGEASTVSLTFSAEGGARDRLVLAGTVLSGVAGGDRIDGGVHLRATYSRFIQQGESRHHRGRMIEQLQRRPLSTDRRDCNVVDPVNTIRIASDRNLSFTAPPSMTHTTGSHTGVAPTSAPTTTHQVPRRHPRSRQLYRAGSWPRPASRRRLVAVNDLTGSNGGGAGPLATVIFVVFLGLCLGLFILVVKPSRLWKPQRTPHTRLGRPHP